MDFVLFCFARLGAEGEQLPAETEAHAAALPAATAVAQHSNTVATQQRSQDPMPRLRSEDPLHRRKQGNARNKMQPTNPNAHTYVNGTDVETHREENLIDVATRVATRGCKCSVWSVSVKCRVRSVKCGVRSVNFEV